MQVRRGCVRGGPVLRREPGGGLGVQSPCVGFLWRPRSELSAQGLWRNAVPVTIDCGTRALPMRDSQSVQSRGHREWVAWIVGSG